MAGLRERGTSFPQSSDYVANGHAVGLMTDASVSSSIVDDVLARIGTGVDFSALFVLESNPTTASVPSLTAASGAGLATHHSVNINARV